MSNPWEVEPTFVNIGGLSTILKINKTICSIDCSNQTKSRNENSIEFIERLKELAELNKEQANIMYEYQMKNLISDYHNILNTSMFDGLISMLDYMTNHLQLIINNKQVLVNRLHKPFVGKYLSVESNYHDLVSKFFPNIVDQVANVSTNLKNLEWVNGFTIRKTDFKDSLDLLLKDLSILQNLFQGMNECRDTLDKLYKSSVV